MKKKRRKIMGKSGCDADGLPGEGLSAHNSMGVQGSPFKMGRKTRSVGIPMIEGISQKRMIQAAEVDADLMGTPCGNGDLQQRHAALGQCAAIQCTIAGHGRFSSQRGG